MISNTVEIFEPPLVGAGVTVLCLIMFHIQVAIDSPESLITALGLYPYHCAGLAGNQARFKKDPAELEETTVLQARLNPRQRKFFNLLGTSTFIPV